jgi:predicted short-subunit dehydrogenase-like oxidoreductase (DUF2520 family)
MKVVIIGSGNVATVFGKKMSGAGHKIIQIAGRNVERVKELSSYFKIDYTTDLSHINPSADIYIISVSDSAISSVAKEIKFKKKLVVHTAAAVSKDVLSNCSGSFGVLYPLQTLKGEITAIPPIPVLVDANDKSTLEKLIEFSTGWADSLLVANDEERLKLHIGAVFVNNFTNHLFTIVQDFCCSNDLEFEIFQPIIEETVSRIKGHSLSKMQTGPALRKDFGTIKKHEKVLAAYPQLLNIYKIFTDSIIAYYEGVKG